MPTQIFLVFLGKHFFEMRCHHMGIAQIAFGYSAQYVFCKVYFSAQPNKLRPILKFEKYYPIEHIIVPACSSVRKIHFLSFSDFQTLDP